MKKNAMAILAALALLALPLAAQVPQEQLQPEPTPVQEAAQEVEQAAEEVAQEAEELGQAVAQEAEEAAQEIDEAIDSATDDTDELPRTASPLAGLLLLGLAGAGLALGLRTARRN